MDKHLISELQFKDYKVNYIKFDLNESFSDRDEIEIEFKLNTEISISKEINEGKVTLISTVFDSAEENNFPFFLEVSLSGFFRAEEEISKENFIKFLEMSGTATLFPFLRSVITDITRISNVKPLVIPLINIYRLRENTDSNSS